MILFDITGFLGRFHPVLVHLPIGFILLALLLDWKNQEGTRDQSVRFTWLLSTITAAISALFGWFLANQGAYDNWTLFFHRWFGIGIAVLAGYAWWSRRRQAPGSKSKKIVTISSIALLLVTGHLGGNMTHGSDYLLEYAPAPIKKLFGSQSEGSDEYSFSDPDSVAVYDDLIFPVFEKKCIGCHSGDVQNGGLNMSTVEAIQEGGENGNVIISGDLGSEVLRRVTLPFSSSKFMPTSGTPMLYHEIKILELWIEQGADYSATLTELEMNPGIQSTLKIHYNLDVTPRPWIEKTKIAPLQEDILTPLRTFGWRINRLSQDNGWLEVIASANTEVTEETLNQLSDVKENVTWLSLADADLKDDIVSSVNEFQNITRLNLKKNQISSRAIEQFTNLKRLESLNLTHTNVDDSIFELLNNFPSLKRIYLWETSITPEALDEARLKYSHIKIEHAALL